MTRMMAAAACAAMCFWACTTPEEAVQPGDKLDCSSTAVTVDGKSCYDITCTGMETPARVCDGAAVTSGKCVVVSKTEEQGTCIVVVECTAEADGGSMQVRFNGACTPTQTDGGTSADAGPETDGGSTADAGTTPDAGPLPTNLPDGSTCVEFSQCTSQVCAGGRCAAPTCLDGVKNGLETDTDCGGSCVPCATGLACSVNQDCLSYFCHNAVCVVSTCNDGLKGPFETDVDCGFQCGPTCAAGKTCMIAASDCMTGLECMNNVCTAPAPADRIVEWSYATSPAPGWRCQLSWWGPACDSGTSWCAEWDVTPTADTCVVTIPVPAEGAYVDITSAEIDDNGVWLGLVPAIIKVDGEVVPVPARTAERGYRVF